MLHPSSEHIIVYPPAIFLYYLPALTSYMPYADDCYEEGMVHKNKTLCNVWTKVELDDVGCGLVWFGKIGRHKQIRSAASVMCSTTSLLAGRFCFVCAGRGRKKVAAMKEECVMPLCFVGDPRIVFRPSCLCVAIIDLSQSIE